MKVAVPMSNNELIQSLLKVSPLDNNQLSESDVFYGFTGQLLVVEGIDTNGKTYINLYLHGESHAKPRLFTEPRGGAAIGTERCFQQLICFINRSFKVHSPFPDHWPVSQKM